MQTISTFNYRNPGRMSDNDGPAFVAYSKIGYSGASATVDLGNTKVNGALSNGKFINAYIFLGIDVFGETEWENCVDVGFAWAGAKGGWHLFYNLFLKYDGTRFEWWESSNTLPQDDIYDLSCKLIAEEEVLFTAKGRTSGVEESVRFKLRHAKLDGSNTSCLFNCALDFPPESKIDRNGDPCEDWPEIVLGNTDKGGCLKNLTVTDMTLYTGTEPSKWTNEKNSDIGIWPDASFTVFDYAPTIVDCMDGSAYHIRLDMDR